MLPTIFIFIVLLSTVWAQCPKGCDCVPDPLGGSSQLLVCRWSAASHDDSLLNITAVRSVSIHCDDDYSLPEHLFDHLASLHLLTIQGCRLPEPTELFKSLENLRSLQLVQVTHSGPWLSLKEGSLASMGRLEKLSVTRSGLLRLPSDTFCALKNLQVLNVSSNALTSLKTEADCVATQLIIADFSRNDLGKIGDHLHVLPALRQLSLAHNHLTSIPASSLAPIAHLQQLDLEDNQIDTVEGLPETLIHVVLAYNKLSVLPPALASLPSLVSLNLSHNSVDEASPSVIASSVLESLDMSWNRVRLLPARLFPHSVVSVVHLNLEGNAIEDIKNMELHNYGKLQTLNLASNRLRLLRDEVFAGLQHLTSLKLANNSLDTIETAVFADLAIDELNLSGNRFTEAPIAIGRLYKLKKIDLSNNKISKLYHFIFNKIPHLHAIDLSHNDLQSVGPYVFSDSAHLSVLDLSFNSISLLFKDSLVKCPQLRKVDLSNNRINNLQDALSQASSIRRLDVSNNRLSILQWDELPTRLEHLSADDNAITLLGAAYKSKVRVASLRNNRVEQLSADQLPHSLEQLDLSGNRLVHIAAGTFGAKTGLRRLNLTANALTSVASDQLEVLEAVHTVEVTLKGNPLTCNCQMDWIRKDSLKRRISVVEMENTTCIHEVDKRLMRLDTIDDEDLLCPYTQVCEPECVCCQFGNCDCKAVCPAGCQCYRDSAYQKNIVKCRALNVTNMQAFTPSDVPMSATHIYLSELSLPILRAHSFLGRTRLQHLHINASRVQTIQPKAFNTLPALKLLDLSDNQLDRFSGDELHKSAAVLNLFLNGNGLTTVEQSLMDKLPALQMMTLHKNALTDVSSALASSRLLSVSLSSNPFRCDCSTRYQAPHWIHDNRQRVADLDRVLCQENVTKAFRENDTTVLSAYPPNVGHDVFVMPMDEFLRDFNRSICVPLSHGFFGQEPQNSILVVLFLAACAFLVVAMILLAVATVRRTHAAISHRRYKASSSLNCSSSPGSSPLPLPLINFDAFVSYSKKDEKMVQDQVCRRLEDADYSLCLLHRDGPIYNHRVHSISDELISQMDASQALVLVLTRNFLENEWRTLQIKTSHQLFAKNRQKRLIAVFVDDGVDQNLLDDELGQMLRKNTVLNLRDPLFWTLLRSALPTRISPPPSDSSQIYSDMYGIVPSAMV